MHSFRKLLPHLRKYRWPFAAVLCSAIGLTSLNLLHPLLIRSLIRTIQKATGQGASRHIALLGILLAATFFVRGFFRFVYMYLGHKLAYSFVGDMRVLLYEHLQKLSARFFSMKWTPLVGPKLARAKRESAWVCL
jgi:ABC-type multidrug transport system fused ATPase/permease subunit